MVHNKKPLLCITWPPLEAQPRLLHRVFVGGWNQRRPEDPECESPLGGSKAPYQEGFYDDY